MLVAHNHIDLQYLNTIVCDVSPICVSSEVTVRACQRTRQSKLKQGSEVVEATPQLARLRARYYSTRFNREGIAIQLQTG